MKRYVLIDSRDRDTAKYPDPNEYVVQLPDTLYTVSSARLMTAELPVSFYVFSAARGNTSLTVSVNGTPQTVTIPDGNYGFTAAAAALAAALTTAFATPMSVTISATTLKCTIASSVLTDTVTVTTTGLASTAKTQWGLGYYLGFDRDAVRTGTGSVTSPRVCSMNPELYVLLEIEELGQMHECGIEGNGGTQGRAFAKIPLNVESYEYNFFDKQITCNVLDAPVAKLSQLHIRFRFHDGTPLDFHGVEHSLTLELECLTGRANHR